MPDAAQPVFDDETVGAVLRSGARYLKDAPIALLDAKVLLKHVLGIDDAVFIERSGDALSAKACERYAALLKRRATGEPVAYITGVKEFWSMAFRVTPDVLIPREDSECLIEMAAARRPRQAPLRILDLGTGSGCLLLALLNEYENASGVGVDRSAAALAVAEDNARNLGMADRAVFLEGDWFAPLSGHFDIIIANPPYIRDQDREGLMRDVSGYEPHGALFAGADGLDAMRSILSQISPFLAPNALVMLECGFDQTGELSALVRSAQLGNGQILTIYDLAGRPRGVAFDRNGQKKD